MQPPLGGAVTRVRPLTVHPVVLRALEQLDGRVVGIRPVGAPAYQSADSTALAEPAPRSRLTFRPGRGALVRLTMVELPALEHGHRPEDNQLERTRTRRANGARRVWRIELPDGRSAGTGLFVDRAVVEEYARSRGWYLLEEAPGG